MSSIAAEGLPPKVVHERRPVAPAPPRVWTVFCAVLLSGIAAGIGVGIASVVALLVLPNSPGMHADPHAIMRWLGESFIGVAVVILPGQAMFFACALVPAILSPQHWSERLALRAPASPAISIPFLLLGTLGLLGLIEYLAPLLGQPSENMQDLGHLLGATHGVEAVAVTLLVSVLPGVCEELLFRGYAQTRFVQRFGAPRGIALAALLFALAHFDPQHVLSVLPIGVWLGTVAWLTRSTWVSMAAHVTNNLAGLATLHALGDETSLPPTLALIGGTACLLCLGAVGVVLAGRRTHAPGGQIV